MPRDNFTYYIHESMLDESMPGTQATAEDAQRMVEVLYDLGYEVQYGNEPNQDKSLIPEKTWDAALDIIRQEKVGQAIVSPEIPRQSPVQQEE